MSESGRHRGWAWLAVAWLLVVGAIGVYQATFWREARLDSDLMALLPGDGEDLVQAAADCRLADSVTQQIIVMLGGDDWSSTRRATQAFRDAIGSDQALRVVVVDQAGALSEALDLLGPHRRGLLTAEQRRRLAQTPADQTMAAALSRLYAPGPGTGLGRWQDDPLGLWPDWWQARAGRQVQPLDGMLAVSAEGRQWSLVRLELTRPALQLDGQRPLQATLARAAEAARAAASGAGLDILQGGVPLHAEAAAAQASREVRTIGVGSLLAVVLILWLAFRGPRPILLVATSLAIGCAAGLTATAWVFGTVHLLTLVFGASLVGVAVDYGMHYFASRQGHPQRMPHAQLRRLLPALTLALTTSSLAYLALGIAPFPGLRQMAVFSAAGLAGAYLTVTLWFPWLDRATPRPSRVAAAVAASLAHWPRWQGGRAGYAAAVVLALFAAGGLGRLEVSDDLRTMQVSPPDLLAQEFRLGQVLGLPSPAQYFLVTADDPESLLQAEEALVGRLQDEVEGGRLAGWRAMSDWLPSAKRQDEDSRLTRRAEAAVLERAAVLLGEAIVTADPPEEPLRSGDFLELEIAEPLRPLWLGEVQGGWASVVMLEGVKPRALPALANVAEGLSGARWVDRTAGISQLLGHYRKMMAWLLLAGYAAVALVLFLRYRRRAWRALLPSLLAATLSLAALGWLGVPLQLFGMLAQLLLLGMGVDYGIFLLEHHDDPSSWLAVTMGAASTLLAFGLLALSSTPALHSFGLSLLLGIGIVWALAPCFRPAAPAVPAP